MIWVALPDHAIPHAGTPAWMLYADAQRGQSIGVMLSGHLPWQHAYLEIQRAWRRHGIARVDNYGVAVVHAHCPSFSSLAMRYVDDGFRGELVLMGEAENAVPTTLVLLVTPEVAALLPPPSVPMLYNAILDVSLMTLLRVPSEHPWARPTACTVQVIGRFDDIEAYAASVGPKTAPTTPTARTRPLNWRFLAPPALFARSHRPALRRLGWKVAEAACEGIPYGIVWAMLRHAGVDSALLTRTLLVASVVSVLAMVPRGYAQARARGA